MLGGKLKVYYKSESEVIDLYYINKNIKNTERIYPMQGRAIYLRLDMNENPGGLPQSFVDRVLQELTPDFLATYPEPDKVRELVAQELDVCTENIFLGNGSDACIRYIFEVFGNPDSNVVTVSPSFEMYSVYCKMFGLEHRTVKYKQDLTLDVTNIIEHIDENTSIVVLLNPNNPIGNVYTEQEVRAIINIAKNAVVVIDEAYHYFYSNTFLDLVRENDNVIILRTFSKLMSLAACRLGIAISNSDLIKSMRNAQPTFEVNSIVLKFAEYILQDRLLVSELIAIEKAGHTYLVQELQKNNYELIDSKGNYLFIKPNRAPNLIADMLKQENILVKTYRVDLLKEYIRVSTGAKEYMQMFLDKFILLDRV